MSLGPHRTAPATAPAAEGTDVLLRVDGHLGRLTLNRPKAINALTLEMVRQLQAGLDVLEADDAIEIVLLDGEGNRGFCAGGDIVALHGSAKDGTDDARIFWSEEYVLNARIANFPKPVVAIMDGVVMGGGIGLAGHASHRLATERLLSAMPEVGIGFTPDVGGSWLLSRDDGHLGTHLALTGARLGARDAIAAGLADRIVASTAVPALIAALATESIEAALPVAEILAAEPDLADNPEAVSADGIAIGSEDALATEVPEGKLDAARDWIAAAYAHETVEEIVSALQARDEPEAQKAATAILRASPTSLKVTLEALKRARALPNLEAALVQELRVSCGFLKAVDFPEGVRAQVIDKDRNPQWNPATLEEVDAATVESFFAPLGEHDLILNANGANA